MSEKYANQRKYDQAKSLYNTDLFTFNLFSTYFRYNFTSNNYLLFPASDQNVSTSGFFYNGIHCNKN